MHKHGAFTVYHNKNAIWIKITPVFTFEPTSDNRGQKVWDISLFKAVIDMPRFGPPPPCTMLRIKEQSMRVLPTSANVQH